MTRLATVLVLIAVVAVGSRRSAAQTSDVTAGHGAIAELIDQRIDEAASELANLPPRISAMREEYARLARELQVVEPQPQTAPPDEETPQEVVFRPPLEKVAKTPAMFVVCENGRLSIVADNQSLNRALDAAQAGPVEQTVSLTGGDFDLQGNTRWATLNVRAVRRPNATGETADEIERPDSKFRRFLKTRKSNEYHLQFNVYPDSHAVFRRARRFAWDARFQVGWFPQASGQDIRFGSGGENRVQ